MTPEARKTKSRLTRRVLDARGCVPEFSACPLDKPQSVMDDEICENGVMFRRRRVVLTAHGCSTPTCSMCPLPNESVPADRRISRRHWTAQIELALRGGAFDTMTVYHNGNFFADREVPPGVRRMLYKGVAARGLRCLVVESLPRFITADALREARKLLGKTRLSVAIGLQSWDETVRELAVNSTCTMAAFKAAAALLESFGYGVQVFLLFHPPFLTIGQSIVDIQNSVFSLAALGIHDPVVCPLRVSARTLVREMLDAGEYKAATLWDLRSALREIHKLCPDTRLRVAVSNLTGADGMAAERVKNCPQCTEAVVAAIGRYNFSHDLGELNALDCPCRPPDADEPEESSTERITRLATQKTSAS